MRTSISLGAALIASSMLRSPADDTGSVPSEASTEPSAVALCDTFTDLTIGGNTFKVKVPYKAGHVLNENEASVLNQTYKENVRNNVAGKIKGASDQHEKSEDANKGEFSIDTFTVPGETEGSSMTLREALQSYADAYEFGQRTSRTPEPVDPVQREARVIARQMLAEAFKAEGIKLKDVPDDTYDQALSELASTDDVQAEASRRVKQRAKIGSGALDIKSLLSKNSSETPSEEPAQA